MSFRLRILLFCNALYLISFAVHFLRTGNYEFLGYLLPIIFIGGLIGFTRAREVLPFWLLAALSFWGFLHLAGGSVMVGENVLYRFVLVDLWHSGEDTVLKFDQLLHGYGFFVAAFVVHVFLKARMGLLAYMPGVALIAALASMGLGAVNEIVEFTAYALLPATGVGGYVNTALDLVANALGALAAAGVIVWRGALARQSKKE